jgi:hypothetical protein
MSTADLINRKLSRELSEGVANMAWRLSWCASRVREMEDRGEFCGIEAYETLIAPTASSRPRWQSLSHSLAPTTR